MAKNIVVCLDGTWNGPGEHDEQGRAIPTNVQKLFERLAGAQALQDDEDEKECTYASAQGVVLQVSKYIHGVGDTSNVFKRIAEGSTGAGLMARLVHAYTFVSRHWVHGDRIVLIGFSRGAYTARALAGLIVSQGLLNWTAMGLAASGDKRAYAAGLAVWAKHKKAKAQDHEPLLTRLDAWITRGMASLLLEADEVPPLVMHTDVGVHAVAVWDTVGALGIPPIVCDGGTRHDDFQFADNDLHPAVRHGFHAVSIDEERADYTPSLWNPRPSGGIAQTLFPGSHSDVGGGYPETESHSGLSDGALLWMIGKLQNTDGGAVLFQTLDGVKPFAAGEQHRPWLIGSFRIRPHARRRFPQGLLVSETTLLRGEVPRVPVELGDHSAYRPSNLIGTYFCATPFEPLHGVEIED